MLAQAQAQMQSQQQTGQQQGSGGGGGGMNGMTGMSFHMNGLGGQNFGNQQGGNAGDLSQQFAAMQNALNRSQQGGNGGWAGDVVGFSCLR